MDLDSISLLGRFIPIMENTLGHIEDQTGRLNKKGTDEMNKIDFESKFRPLLKPVRTNERPNRIFAATRWRQELLNDTLFIKID